MAANCMGHQKIYDTIPFVCIVEVHTPIHTCMHPHKTCSMHIKGIDWLAMEGGISRAWVPGWGGGGGGGGGLKLHQFLRFILY